MYSSAIIPRFIPQFRTAGPSIAEPTLRVETPPTQEITSHLIPSAQREVVMSQAAAALGPQILCARSLANGDRRRLDDYADTPYEPFSLA